MLPSPTTPTRRPRNSADANPSRTAQSPCAVAWAEAYRLAREAQCEHDRVFGHGRSRHAGGVDDLDSVRVGDFGVDVVEAGAASCDDAQRRQRLDQLTGDVAETTRDERRDFGERNVGQV